MYKQYMVLEMDLTSAVAITEWINKTIEAGYVFEGWLPQIHDQKYPMALFSTYVSETNKELDIFGEKKYEFSYKGNDLSDNFCREFKISELGVTIDSESLEKKPESNFNDLLNFYSEDVNYSRGLNFL
jgi:hypothetical protein